MNHFHAGLPKNGLTNRLPLKIQTETLPKIQEALLAVVDATRAYLPPDGIDEQECISRILQATDNAEISPIILEIGNERV